MTETPKQKISVQRTNFSGQIYYFLDLCAKIKDLVPTRQDTKLSKALKIVTIVKNVIPEKKQLSIKNRGFVSTNSEQFVSFFTGLHIGMDFEEHDHFKVGGALIHEYYDPTVGTIVLFEQLDRDQESKIGFEPVFYHSPDFDFNIIAERAWKTAKKHIQVESFSKQWRHYFKYTAFEPILNRQFGKAERVMQKFIGEHRVFRNKKISRSYLFIGPPGTGKSTMAQKFATDNHERIMRIDADTMYETRGNEFINVLKFMKPDCLVINEIDKKYFFSQNWRTGGNILQLLEDIKDMFPDLTMLFTANSLAPLPEAMIRPGRIDDIIEFELPDKDDRKEIIRGYLAEFGKEVDEGWLDGIAEKSDKLSGAYLREIAFRACNEECSEEELNSAIERMIRIIVKKREQTNE